MEKRILKLDRLVAVYKKITPYAFAKFVGELDYLEKNGLIEKVRHWKGKGISEYHHNFKVGNVEEGSVIIQYKHNTQAEGQSNYDLRIEFNPSKIDEQKRNLFDLIQVRFGMGEYGRTVINVTMMELALDVEVDPRAIMVLPKQGREENRIQGNKYYGMRGRHGRLKVYDKKREREEKGIKVDAEKLTRIEFTWRGEVKLENLETVKLGADKLYEIKVWRNEKVEKAEIRAYILAIATGNIQLKEFTRTNQRHIKEALKDCETLGLDGMFDYRLPEIKREICGLLVDSYEFGKEVVV